MSPARALARFVRPWLTERCCALLDRWDKGTAVVVTTHFQPEDYREFLAGSWPEMPFDQMKEIIIKHED